MFDPSEEGEECWSRRAQDSVLSKENSQKFRSVARLRDGRWFRAFTFVKEAWHSVVELGKSSREVEVSKKRTIAKHGRSRRAKTSDNSKVEIE